MNPIELSDAQRWAAYRGVDRICPAAIHHPGVYQRLVEVDLPTNQCHYFLDHLLELGLIPERRWHVFEPTVAFYVDLVEAVNQDVCDRAVRHQRLQRSHPHDLVEERIDQIGGGSHLALDHGLPDLVQQDLIPIGVSAERVDDFRVHLERQLGTHE